MLVLRYWESLYCVPTGWEYVCRCLWVKSTLHVYMINAIQMCVCPCLDFCVRQREKCVNVRGYVCFSVCWCLIIPILYVQMSFWAATFLLRGLLQNGQWEKRDNDEHYLNPLARGSPGYTRNIKVHSTELCIQRHWALWMQKELRFTQSMVQCSKCCSAIVSEDTQMPGFTLTILKVNENFRKKTNCESPREDKEGNNVLQAIFLTILSDLHCKCYKYIWKAR